MVCVYIHSRPINKYCNENNIILLVMVNISTHIMNIERFIIMTGNECQLNTAAQ